MAETNPRVILAERLLALHGVKWRTPTAPDRDLGTAFRLSDGWVIVCDPPTDDWRLATLLHELAHTWRPGPRVRQRETSAQKLVVELECWQWAKQAIANAGMQWTPEMTASMEAGMASHLETHQVISVHRVEGDAGCLFDFPVSDTFARYEAWLEGIPMPALLPDLPPLPERGAFNRAHRGCLSYPISPVILPSFTLKKKRKPPQRGGLDV